MKAKKWVAENLSSKRFRLFVEVVILAATGYLMLKNIFGFSVSGWLSENAFKQPLVDVFGVIAALLVVLAFLFRVVMLYLEQFPANSHMSVEPDEISNCLHRMNTEISGHLAKCEGAKPSDIKLIHEQHGFLINLALITDSLAEHIRKSVSKIKIKKKDLFISLYAHNEGGGSLEYVLHYDSKRDLVKTRTITLGSSKFSQYESVKCMKSSNSTIYVLHAAENYARGGSKRHKTVKHYLGCKLCSGQKVFGFLNIEFHHNVVFADEDEMQDFMEENVYPFRLLLEYQFLKREFFFTFRDFEDNWRAA